MYRRGVLRGLVAGVPLFAGCSALSGSDGGNESTDTGGGGTTVAATMTETARETATQTATATAPQTAITTPRVTEQVSTAGQVTTAGGAFGVVIDSSELTTYISDVYPYSVLRPAGWTVDASDPTNVVFESETGFAREGVIVSEGVGAMNLDTLVSFFNDYFSQEFDGYRVLNQRDVTLQNGNPATVVGATITDSSLSGVTLRGKYVFTIVDRTAYAVQVLVFEETYTSTTERAMTEIVESLTVESRGTITSQPL